MRRVSCALCSILAVGFFTAAVVPAFGGIAIIDQSRSLHIEAALAGAPPAGFDQTVSADPNMPFNQSLHDAATSTAPFTGTNLVASVSADQNSTIVAGANTISLNALGGVNGDAGPSPGASANGTSSYSVTFTLDAPATYTLNADIMFDPNSSTSEVLLTGGTTRIGLSRGADSGASGAFYGTLPPGTYTLTADAFGAGAPDAFSGTYNAMFTIITATAVPLPPAAGPACGLIGLLAVAGMVGRCMSGSSRRMSKPSASAQPYR